MCSYTWPKSFPWFEIKDFITDVVFSRFIIWFCMCNAREGCSWVQIMQWIDFWSLPVISEMNSWTRIISWSIDVIHDAYVFISGMKCCVNGQHQCPTQSTWGETESLECECQCPTESTSGKMKSPNNIVHFDVGEDFLGVQCKSETTMKPLSCLSVISYCQPRLSHEIAPKTESAALWHWTQNNIFLLCLLHYDYDISPVSKSELLLLYKRAQRGSAKTSKFTVVETKA